MSCRPKSSVNVSVQHFLGDSGLRLPCHGYHTSACLGTLFPSILCTCPSHCSFVILKMNYSVSIAVLCLISSFRLLSFHVILHFETLIDETEQRMYARALFDQMQKMCREVIQHFLHCWVLTFPNIKKMDKTRGQILPIAIFSCKAYSLGQC